MEHFDDQHILKLAYRLQDMAVLGKTLVQRVLGT